MAAAAPADAQYPQRPVRIIVPFAPGGASDFVGRVIRPQLSETLGQPVVIDNRSGATGNIGVEVAAPDGHTLLLGNAGTMAINRSRYPKFPRHPPRSPVPITQVVDVPGSLVAHPSVPARTVKELVFDAARKSMAEPEVISRLQASGVAAVTSQSPAAFREFVDAEIKRFGTVIREAKITAD